MNYFELYDTQEAVLDRLEQLKGEGFYEEDIHLLGRDDAEFTALEYTEVNYHSHVPNERGLREILSNTEPAERFLNRYNLGEDEIEKYLFKISEGNFLMFYDDDMLKKHAEEMEDLSSSSEADLIDRQ